MGKRGDASSQQDKAATGSGVSSAALSLPSDKVAPATGGSRRQASSHTAGAPTQGRMVPPAAEVHAPVANSENDADDSGSHDGVVADLLNKRARAVRKKLANIARVEQLKSEGRAINAEQELALGAKSANEATLKELENLCALLPPKVAQERAAAAAEAEKLALEAAQPPGLSPEEVERLVSTRLAQAIERLVSVLYVSALFGDGAAEHKAERETCLAWDAYEAKVRVCARACMHDSPHGACAISILTDCSVWASRLAQPDGLTAADLAHLGQIGRVLTSRPFGQLVSHDAALKHCVTAAAAWMQGTGKLGDVPGAWAAVVGIQHHAWRTVLF